ncbi:hypothetical protein H6P81_011425 [Aristolochia fimbriata]|uniref:Uncharacterized protein n=1 Tax=Aristolochia fimbriata TaxID=158543 RepID=A0AAV7ERG3_ARIFI|nr:hypothetical protein H6P81_011425 [Aristolochia fimbriata]
MACVDAVSLDHGSWFKSLLSLITELSHMITLTTGIRRSCPSVQQNHHVLALEWCKSGNQKIVTLLYDKMPETKAKLRLREATSQLFTIGWGGRGNV